MAPIVEFALGAARLRNSIRIEVPEVDRDVKDLRFLVEEILFKILDIRRSDIFCLQDPSRGIFVLTLGTVGACRTLYDRLKTNQGNPVLDRMKFIMLYEIETPVVVHIFNPFVSNADIILFLSKYCTEVRFSHGVRNCCNLWSGKRKFFVQWKRDAESVGGQVHPPSSFTLGKDRGYLFYPDMPRYCRRCGKYDHSQQDCTDPQPQCRNCGKWGHVTTSCPQKKTCSICGGFDHLFKDCPERSAKKVWKKPVNDAVGESSKQKKKASYADAVASGTPQEKPLVSVLQDSAVLVALSSPVPVPDFDGGGSVEGPGSSVSLFSLSSFSGSKDGVIQASSYVTADGGKRSQIQKSLKDVSSLGKPERSSDENVEKPSLSCEIQRSSLENLFVSPDVLECSRGS